MCSAHEQGFDCTLLGNGVPEEGGELWSEGALTKETHPTYPSTEYVHIGPFARQTLEPLASDTCINFCGCEYKFQYGDWPAEEDEAAQCFDNTWADERADGMLRAGCVLEEEGQMERLASPFDYQSMASHPKQQCGIGFERRWSRCCRAVLVGTCASSGQACVASGPIMESEGDSHQASDFDASVICGCVATSGALLRSGRCVVGGTGRTCFCASG